jgi:hypothetical protein
MTMAVASHQPNARNNCGGAEAAAFGIGPFSEELMGLNAFAPGQNPNPKILTTKTPRHQDRIATGSQG